MRAVILVGTIIFLVLIATPKPTLGAGGLNCTIVANNTCPGGFLKIIGLENSTGGFDNAHSQNNTLNTYANSLCCESTDTGVTITNSCSGTTILRLSSTTNAHIQQTQVNTYPETTCLESDLGTPECSYPTGSCAAGSECLLSMASSEGDDTTNAHAASCTAYNTKICCSVNNTAPTKVTSLTPINESQVTDRTPLFNWTQATDSDGDPITYRIQIALTDNFTSIVLDNETANTNFTPGSDMAFNTYYWRVYANDSRSWSVSDTENFSLITFINLNLTTDTVDFGNMLPTDQNDTTDNSPAPLVIENLGNVEANLSINASNLFDSASLNTSNYRYKASNVTGEEGAFDWAASTTSFSNMPDTPVQFATAFNYTASLDEAEIDLGVTVPGDEPTGAKTSTITITGEAS